MRIKKNKKKVILKLTSNLYIPNVYLKIDGTNSLKLHQIE